MRAVVQRALEAKVVVEGQTVGEICQGLCVLVGAGDGDGEAEMRYIADKIIGLRIFSDDQGKMNLSVQDVAGGVLLISQFTLYGDARKGRRPAFTGALEPTRAKELYEQMQRRIAAAGVPVATGVFGADMKVHLINDGPVTILLDSAKQF